jgi:hypothetical protein
MTIPAIDVKSQIEATLRQAIIKCRMRKYDLDKFSTTNVCAEFWNDALDTVIEDLEFEIRLNAGGKP